MQGAGTYGVYATARLAIEGCTIGLCATSGRGGGILARAGCEQLRLSSGLNENRVQRDANDKGYSGYGPDCGGCVGRCTCSALYAYAAAMSSDGPVKWARAGEGSWTNVGCL